jgi:hypothetical protein
VRKYVNINSTYAYSRPKQNCCDRCALMSDNDDDLLYIKIILSNKRYKLYIVTYSGFSIHDGTLLHSKSQYTTVKHSRKLLEHTYTSDLYGTRTLFQQDLLWQSSDTHSNSGSQKASKHTRSIRRRAIGSLAHHNGTSASSPPLACHLPDPTIECLHRPPYKLMCSSRNFPIRT